jgi:hypothetical protein
VGRRQQQPVAPFEIPPPPSLWPVRPVSVVEGDQHLRPDNAHTQPWGLLSIQDDYICLGASLSLFLFDPFVSMSESFHWNCHSSFCLLLIFPVHVFLSFSRCINVYTFLLFPLSRNMRRGPNDFLRFYFLFYFFLSLSGWAARYYKLQRDCRSHDMAGQEKIK